MTERDDAMPQDNDLYEDKFARTYAEIRRIDELRRAEGEAHEKLAAESYRRLDQRIDAQETAVAAALVATEKSASVVAATLADTRLRLDTMGTAISELRSRIDVGPASLTALQASAAESIGHRSGAVDTRTAIYAVLGAIGVIVGILATVIAVTTR